MTGSSRVVLAKVGLDGHDVGVNLVAKELVRAGFEVVYLGKRIATDVIVAAAIAEDVDAVGLSCLSGGLAHFAIRVVEGLEKAGAPIPVLVGGIEEPNEVERMLDAGVRSYFGPGSTLDDVVNAFSAAVAASV